MTRHLASSRDDARERVADATAAKPDTALFRSGKSVTTLLASLDQLGFTSPIGSGAETWIVAFVHTSEMFGLMIFDRKPAEWTLFRPRVVKWFPAADAAIPGANLLDILIAGCDV